MISSRELLFSLIQDAARAGAEAVLLFEGPHDPKKVGQEIARITREAAEEVPGEWEGLHEVFMRMGTLEP